MTAPRRIGDRAEFLRVLRLARERADALLAAAPESGLAIGIVRQLEYIRGFTGPRGAPSEQEAEVVLLGAQAASEVAATDLQLGAWLSELDDAFKRWAKQRELFR
jgi:hypothetical protein